MLAGIADVFAGEEEREHGLWAKIKDKPSWMPM
jgi:hypothetical protein